MMQLNDSVPHVNLLSLQDRATVNKGDGCVPVWAKNVEPTAGTVSTVEMKPAAKTELT